MKDILIPTEDLHTESTDGKHYDFISNNIIISNNKKELIFKINLSTIDFNKIVVFKCKPHENSSNKKYNYGVKLYYHLAAGNELLIVLGRHSEIFTVGLIVSRILQALEDAKEITNGE